MGSCVCEACILWPDFFNVWFSHSSTHFCEICANNIVICIIVHHLYFIRGPTGPDVTGYK